MKKYLTVALALLFIIFVCSGCYNSRTGTPRQEITEKTKERVLLTTENIETYISLDSSFSNIQSTSGGGIYGTMPYYKYVGDLSIRGISKSSDYTFENVTIKTSTYIGGSVDEQIIELNLDSSGNGDYTTSITLAQPVPLSGFNTNTKITEISGYVYQ